MPWKLSSFFLLISLTNNQWVLNLWVYDFTLYSFLWEEEMPFESKLTGFKSLTYRLHFVSKIYVFIYLRRVVYVCHIVFLIIAIIVFFLGGGLSLWNNLWDIVILQLCFVHLLVPSSNWLALNIICGLLVMELA